MCAASWCELHIEDTVDDLQSVISSGQRLIDDAVKFAEGGQGSGSHPYDEVLVDEAVVICSRVELVDGPPPVHRLCCA